MPKNRTTRPRVFVDADVLFAGSVSPSEQGASLVILRMAEIALIEAITSEQVVTEAERNLEKKLSPALSTFRLLVDRCLQVVPNPSNEDIQMDLNVWDFGGQDIYHATHQFYLTNHSLFVLVWSARMGYEAGKIYKWLETIEALAPDSPILIVATYSKDRGADLPKGDIQTKYPDKVHFFEVDNQNKQGINELKEALR